MPLRPPSLALRMAAMTAQSPLTVESGTYVHGLFADDRQRAAWIARLGGRPAGFSYERGVESMLDALAAHLEAHIDIDRLLRLAR